MADRFQDRSYGAGAHGRGGDRYGSEHDDSDPLAELARLIGQSDPFGSAGGRANAQVPPRSAPRQGTRHETRPEYRQDYASPPEPDETPVPQQNPPSWMQRANHRREAPRDVPRDEPQVESDDYLSPVHPVHRYAAQPQQPQADSYYQDDESAYQHDQAHAHGQAYANEEPEIDPSRYDDALYGQIAGGAQDFQREPAYPDDPYAYEGYGEEETEEPVQRRRSPMLVVIAVLMLGVIGTGAAYAYRSYFTARRSGEPPIIRADNSPTKIIPAQSDSGTKMPDRMLTADAAERIVPREEQPVDVNARAAGPRVVFPPLNPNSNPPQVASVAPTAMPALPPPAAPNDGTLPNGEPHKIKTLTVRGDQPDAAAMPVNAPPPVAPGAAAKTAGASRAPKVSASQANANANASAAGPLSLAPQTQPPPPLEVGTRVAAVTPTQIAPSANPVPAASGSSGGSYLVSITSQPSEADARASFLSMQSKYPSVLASQSPVVARGTTKNGAVIYRAGVSFSTQPEAARFCHSYVAAGGQCWVVKN
jgi:hypothetical protein